MHNNLLCSCHINYTPHTSIFHLEGGDTIPPQNHITIALFEKKKSLLVSV